MAENYDQVIEFENGGRLGIKYQPVAGSGNAFLTAKYRTHIYMLGAGSQRYDLGYWDEKLDEESIKARFEEIIRVNQERQYGTQGTVLRRELSPRRERGQAGGQFINRGISRSILGK